jgi:hypothetical protein
MSFFVYLTEAILLGVVGLASSGGSDETTFKAQAGLKLASACGRFCCKSRLRQASKRDSVVLTRIAAESIHDGPSEE